MTIRELYLMCGNMADPMNIRVLQGKSRNHIYIGTFRNMPEEVKQSKVAIFELDDDFEGCLIIIYPA